ncbi:MAG: TerC family protein [Alphaproteobacteria bacterium]
MDWLTNPEIWIALATLTVLEIVLGIDNIVFLSIMTSRLPQDRQASARRLGLALALLMRIAFLFALVWIIGLAEPLFHAFGQDVSWRDLILFGGGVFLVWKATQEIHSEMEGDAESGAGASRATFAVVVTQIVLIDLVFSLDSILTAIGLAEEIGIMIAAVVVAMVVMLLAAEPVAAFVNRHPSIKMLALAFLMLIGMALIADGLEFHIPRGYLYSAVAFSVLVEALNLGAASRRRRRRAG